MILNVGFQSISLVTAAFHLLRNTVMFYHFIINCLSYACTLFTFILYTLSVGSYSVVSPNIATHLCSEAFIYCRLFEQHFDQCALKCHQNVAQWLILVSSQCQR